MEKRKQKTEEKIEPAPEIKERLEGMRKELGGIKKEEERIEKEIEERIEPIERELRGEEIEEEAVERLKPEVRIEEIRDEPLPLPKEKRALSIKIVVLLLIISILVALYFSHVEFGQTGLEGLINYLYNFSIIYLFFGAITLIIIILLYFKLRKSK